MTNQLQNDQTCDTLKKTKKSGWKYCENVGYESSHELRQGKAGLNAELLSRDEDILTSSRIYEINSIFAAFI
jgi:hypothetical protein